MRLLYVTIAVALITTTASAADAQGAPAPPPTPAATASASSGFFGRPSQWTAAGFVGSTFGAQATAAGVDVGGQVAYLYRGVVGGEFVADFAPSFKVNNLFLANNPNVNTYMANVVGAAPLGASGMVQPYVSAGVGAVQMRSDVLNIALAPASGETSISQSRFGGDVGAGLMWFTGKWGLRADARYYRAFTNTSTPSSTTSPADAFGQTLLSGLDFWRANIGIALRW